MTEILLLLIGVLFFLLFLAGGVFFYYKKLNSKNKVLNQEQQVRQETSSVGVSESYIKELESMLHKAFEDAARAATANLESEFKSTIGELAQQNNELVNSVRELENRFINEFESSVGSMRNQLNTSLAAAVESMDTKSKEMAVAVQSLEESTKNKIEQNLGQIVQSMQGSLSGTGAEIQTQIKQTILGAIQEEVDGFRNAINIAREETIQSLTQIHTEVEKEKQELEAEMMKQVEARRKKLLSGLDNKINDVVVQFLIENLGDSLDLNDQQDYIFKVLEENKEELKKEIHG